MTRALISISEDSKRWLDQYSRQHKISFAHAVRLAIDQFQKSQGETTYRELLAKTAGLLKSRGKTIDGVQFVRKLREEWD